MDEAGLSARPFSLPLYAKTLRGYVPLRASRPVEPVCPARKREAVSGLPGIVRSVAVED